jgi:hypothetical protein
MEGCMEEEEELYRRVLGGKKGNEDPPLFEGKRTEARKSKDRKGRETTWDRAKEEGEVYVGRREEWANA